MGHTRLTRQKVDKLMGREKKRKKTEDSNLEGSSTRRRSDHREVYNRSTQNARENVEREDNCNGSEELKKDKIMDVRSGIKDCITDLHVDNRNNANAPDVFIDDEYVESNVNAENNLHDLPENDIDTDESKCYDCDTCAKDNRGKCGEVDKMKENVINSDNLLGCLLTCGSQRLSNVMYSVVRSVLSGKECSVCSTPVPGAKLPGMTYLKKKVKPRIQMNLLPKHKVIQLRVDPSRSGAKLGIDKYSSDSLAPLTYVSPCEWARVDFATPSVRKLIWDDVTNDGTVFSNIESTPIVRNRSFFPAVNTVRDSGGLESLVGKKSRLQLTFVRTSKTDKALQNAFADCVEFRKVNGVESAVVSCEVLDYEYVSDDRKGHNGINCDGKALVLENHEGKGEKAGDVIFYLKCENGVARLVNSHNCDEFGHPCRLEVCNGKRTGCHVRSFPAEDVVCIGSTEALEDYVPNKGILADGRKYYIYRFLLYTDGFNAHRSRLGSMDGMYILPLGIPIDRRTEAGCLHKICLAPPGVSATDIMDEVIDDLAEGMRNGIEVDDDGERALIFPDVVVYTGDGPALASATGSKGHSADCPCHACLFRKDKENVLTIVGSEVNTTTCFAKRTHTKIRDIERQKGVDKECMNNIGVSNSNAPLMNLSDKVKGLIIPKTSEGKQVVPNCFDAFRFALISPDHVFLGLINNVMEMVLKMLKRVQREKLDRCLTDILRTNGLYGRTTILNSEMNIMKTTISEAFAIMFAAPVAIKCCNFGLNKDDQKALKTAVKLITQLSRIIVRSQEHPKCGVDNESDMRRFNNCHGRKRLKDLVSDAREYCETIKDLSRIDTKHVGILDKPNMHRFVELFVHSLPMFGSMRFIEELILEKAHQTAKKAIDMSNKKNEQLQAMNDYLFDDFKCRLKSVTKFAGIGDDTRLTRDIAQLTGNGNILNADTVTDLNVLTVLRILGKDICNRYQVEEWYVEGRSENKFPHKSEKQLDSARQFVEKALDLMSQREMWKDWSCSQAMSASLVKPVGELNEMRKVAKALRFDVLEVHCHDGSEERPFVLRRSELDGERRFIVVIGFLHTIQDGKKVEYAVGHFMDPISDNSAPVEEEMDVDIGKLQEEAKFRSKDDPSVQGDKHVTGTEISKTEARLKQNKSTVVYDKNNSDPRNVEEYAETESERENGAAEEEYDATRKVGEEDMKETAYERNETCVVIFELSRSVRKAFKAHACWLKTERTGNADRCCGYRCSFTSHPESILEGGKWVLKGRKDGFPPRIG